MKQNIFDDCIIMAGGSGTRLWPASNSQAPKQFLAGPGGKSFFLQAVERGLAVTAPAGRLIIIAGKSHAPLVTAACSPLSEAEKGRITLIVEPLPRNTAAAIACGTVFAQGGFEEARNILVLTSDHVIEPLENFCAAAEAAAAASMGYFSGSNSGDEGGEHLAVFGIAPGRPETGYGYIETAELLSLGKGQLAETGALCAAQPTAYRAASFREKPDLYTAEQFLEAGNFYWNSGMFAFTTRFMLEEFRLHAPDILAPFTSLSLPAERRAAQGIRTLENWPGLAEAYEAVRPESIDYAIAEKCRKVIMIAGNFRWLDVGSWDEYARLLEDRSQGSEIYAASSISNSCFVDSDIPVALCGVEDLIIVIRGGKNGGPAAALVAKKGETQKVRGIVEQIKAAGKTELL
jgi:mannose-1-phosphate guanylyltransferase/mannose-1-phosphate guanylyltransferase/mannose-6-phosphate isomerase